MTKTTKKTKYTPKRKPILTADCNPSFHPVFGNEKLGGKEVGMMGIGYLSGVYPTFADGTYTTDMIGTCSKVKCGACKDKVRCYAVRGETRFPDVRKNRIENTLQLRNDMTTHFQEIEKAIIDNNVKIVRYTESGEIENFAQFLSVYRLARKLTGVRFYLYTKNYDVLRTFFNSLVLPENMVVLISVWGSYGIKEYNEFKKYRNVKCFAVNSELNPRVFCPAYKKDSKTGKVVRDVNMSCAKCGLCFNSNARVIGCLEH